MAVATKTGVLETYAAPRELSDQNSQGTQLGNTTSDLVAFYGGTPVAQPSNPGTQSNSLLNMTSTGVIIKYQTAVIPFAVNATTAQQNTSSVTTNVQPGWQFQTSSVYAINKPTLQASLGVGGIVCATTGIINVNYLNISSAAITPTAEANDVIEIRTSPLTTTATLSPANVAINTTAEQIFTLATSATSPVICLPGTLAIVNKPTNQAALAYSPFARVVGINQVGITFGCITSGVTTTGVLPTAAENYQMAFLPQLNAYCPTYIYGLASGGTAIAASTTLEQTTAVTGVWLGDMVSGVSLSSSAVGKYFCAGGRVSTGLPGSNTSSVYLCYGVTSTGATPVTSEVVLATIQRQQPLNPMMIYNATLATSSIAASTSAEVTTTVTGLLVSSSVLVNKPSCTPGLMVTNARVSAANTLALQYTNFTTTAINVPSETYTIGNVQLQGPGLGYTTTAGLFVAQSYYPTLQQSITLSNALRSALLAMNQISGL